ncbi:hypothetical protein J1770_gp65 [Gordonia phage EMoore]|uniref:Uncharacterized protein n=1 Tax=Gordonia phage EMoore TaxID=2656534 RepID=A0A649VTE1_9CAUD|nr:hypothetical protein J1770_gp65 [Gordonia phage EMoore]QGJ95850.1 hypothetical protein SEA_EMOORE_65 [Gordonia phage EMoore]
MADPEIDDAQRLPMAIKFSRLDTHLIRARIVAVNEDGSREPIACIDYTLEQAAEVAHQLLEAMQ